jgi:hypothetical protein
LVPAASSDNLLALSWKAGRRFLCDQPPMMRIRCSRQVFALLLRRADGCGRRTARIVPILHAFLEESITRTTLQPLLVRTEPGGCHFCLASTAKHGRTGESTIKAAARNA